PRPPPTPPLFPYTTLFRSTASPCRPARRTCLPSRSADDRRRGRLGQTRRCSSCERPCSPPPRPHAEARDTQQQRAEPEGDDDGRDRKSTRLNSSHDQISYA